ncbi:hypothetical protein [Nonomuraea sp. JJY05]|uniref:hypothetical protein n=1 Tax=Nonomuraea sp. JJY05 TaxID=3350255 RepID=UPI00373ED21C
MTDRIELVVRAEGLALLVPGDDPAEAHRQALKFAADDDVTVDDSPAGIFIRSVRGLPLCGPLCCGCGDDVHYVMAQDGDEGAFRAAMVACHVCTAEERAAREAAAEAIRRETRTSWLGIDLGQCHASGVAIIQFTCGHGCERAPQRVCAMHRDGAIETTKGTSGTSICRSCEEAGRGDVPIRLLSCKPLTTNDQEVTR